MDFTERLSSLMAERELGVRALARAVPCDKGLVSRVVNGRQAPSARIAQRMDVVLGAGGELAGLASAERSRSSMAVDDAINPDDEQRVMLAAGAPHRLDATVIGSLAAVLAAQRRLEDRIGSAPVLAPVTAQLAIAADLAADARGPLRSAMLAVAGQYAQFAGWLNANTQRFAKAGVWYDRALEWGTEGGDPNLVATALNMKGHAAWINGMLGPMAGLSRAAHKVSGISPGVRSLAVQQEARAHALAGDEVSASRLLDQAAGLAGHAAAHIEDEPDWIYFFDPDFLVMQRGLALLYLGNYARAAELLAAGLAAMPDNVRQSEWAAWYVIRLAVAHAHSGDLPQACAVALGVVSVARRTGSARLAKMLGRLHASLAQRWPAHPGVTALSEALRS